MLSGPLVWSGGFLIKVGHLYGGQDKQPDCIIGSSCSELLPDFGVNGEVVQMVFRFGAQPSPKSERNPEHKVLDFVRGNRESQWQPIEWRPPGVICWEAPSLPLCGSSLITVLCRNY